MMKASKPLMVLFVVAALLAVVLGFLPIAVGIFAIVMQLPDPIRAVWGSLLYFGIAAACLYAYHRLKRDQPMAAGSNGDPPPPA
jgi:hypothetical protein